MNIICQRWPYIYKKIIETICNFFVASNCGSIVTKFSRVCCSLSVLLITLFSIFRVCFFYVSLVFFLKVLWSVVFHNTLVCLSVCSYI